MSYDIFLSYRRKNADGHSNVGTVRTFMYVFDKHQYDVFFDFNDCTDEYFSDSILPAIRTCRHFVLVLTRGCFERCKDEGDWLRREIEEAIKFNRKIIPITPDGEVDVWPNDLPKTINALVGLQITTIHTDAIFEANMEQLIRNRLSQPQKHKTDGMDNYPKLKVTSNLDCVLYVDNEDYEWATILANQLEKVPLKAGEYILRFESVENKQDFVEDEAFSMPDKDKLYKVDLLTLKLEREKKEEQERLERERLERERREKELQERLERERRERERKEKEEQERVERVERERKEKERLERERKEKERLERERMERERREKEEQERLERERMVRERKEKEERERREKEEQERLERERKERDRREKEEQERLERERMEREERGKFEVEGVKFKMVWVEGGTFMMGGKLADDAWFDEMWFGLKPVVREVKLDDYYIGETVVTQKLWEAVMRKNPSKFKGDSSLPVENVSWKDAQKFIGKLNLKTGMHFRLPTEAEWEYAARGGKNSKGYKYSGSNSIDEVAWYDGNSGARTHPVKEKKANELGLYDMSGNVGEWCNDWYGFYSSTQRDNPVGPSSGTNRVRRGGDWRSTEMNYVTHRDQATPSYRDKGTGFRIVLAE